MIRGQKLNIGAAEIDISIAFPPYAPPTHKKVSSFLKEYKGRPGLYIITDRAGKPLYIGATRSDLYKAVTRKFQVWNDTAFSRPVYDRRRSYVHLVTFKGLGDNLLALWAIEKLLIDRFKPRDNKEGNYTPYNPKSREAGRTGWEPLDNLNQQARDADREAVEELAAAILNKFQ